MHDTFNGGWFTRKSAGGGENRLVEELAVGISPEPRGFGTGISSIAVVMGSVRRDTSQRHIMPSIDTVTSSCDSVCAIA